jgi:hypothetical protein
MPCSEREGEDANPRATDQRYQCLEIGANERAAPLACLAVSIEAETSTATMTFAS